MDFTGSIAGVNCGVEQSTRALEQMVCRKRRGWTGEGPGHPKQGESTEWNKKLRL